MPSLTRATAPQPTLPRDHALDRLRGAALVAMVVHHVIGWLTGGEARDILPGWHSFAVTDVAAPAFFVAAGMSAALFVEGRRRRSVPMARVAAQLVRRYGLLVPLGVGLQWVLGRPPFGFGVLEALGLTVVVGAAIAVVVPRRMLWGTTTAVLVAGVLAERAVGGHDDWLAVELVGGRFPVITYVGFVLVGMAAVHTGRYIDRRWVASAALLAVAAVVALLVAGVIPDRYPGDVPFVVPGLAGTVLAYAVGQLSWPSWLRPADSVLRQAGSHTLGVFLAHYGLYAVLDRSGLKGSVDEVVAVPAAIAAVVVLCAVAPRVPRPPWSLRTGRRRTVTGVRAVQPAPGAAEPVPLAGHPTSSDLR
ncbi:MAG: heparan-alpha-glucosaminide N-acetyltransferase domain-containing protein [Acidimicrobiales bacterium]